MLIFIMTYKLAGVKPLQREVSVPITRFAILAVIGLLVFPLLSVNSINAMDSSIQHFTNISSEITAVGLAQNDPVLPAQIKILLQNAIQEIRNNDIGKALSNLNLVERQLVALGNSPQIQSLKVNIKDGIGLLQVGSADKALLRLNQANQQITALTISKQNTTTTTKPAPGLGGGAKTAVRSNLIPTKTSTASAGSAAIGANKSGLQTSGISGCTLIPGAAMTFRIVCPHRNNVTTPSSSVIPSPQTPPSGLPPQTLRPIAPETPPLAIAGPSQTAASGIIVTLNGSGSYDPDGDKIIRYRWSESRSDPQVALSNYTASTPYFASPIVQNPTNLTFFLTVNDGRHDGVPASTTVVVLPKQLSPTVSTQNTPPTSRNNMTTPPLTPLSKPLLLPSKPLNPPLVPRSAANNNTNILSLLQRNPGTNSSSQLNASTVKQYNNPIYGIRIQYPSNWKLEEGDNFLFGSGVTNVATFVPPGGVTGARNYHTYLAISIEPSNNSSLNDYLNYTLNQYAGLPGFNKTESNTNAVLAGNPAYIVQYNDQHPGFPTKELEVGTLLGYKAYFISFASDPQTFSLYLPNVYTMIKSLSINSGNTLQNTTSSAQTNFNSPQIYLPAEGAGASGTIPK